MPDTIVRYQLAVSGDELTLILKALDEYEAAPASSAILSGIMSALVSKEAPDKDQMIKTLRGADGEMRQRKLNATRLRLKILEAQERPSEFQAP